MTRINSHKNASKIITKLAQKFFELSSKFFKKSLKIIISVNVEAKTSNSAENQMIKQFVIKTSIKKRRAIKKMNVMKDKCIYLIKIFKLTCL